MMDEIREQSGQTILAQRSVLAEEIVARQYREQPQVWERYGPEGRTTSVRDTTYHLTYLAESLSASEPALFTEYVTWARALFAGLNLPQDALVATLETTRLVLEEMLPDQLAAAADDYLIAGLDELREWPGAPAPELQAGATLGTLAARYLDALLRGDRHEANQIVQRAVVRGVSIQDIYLNIFQPAQHEVGRLWQMHQLSVAQEHYCTASTQWIMAQLYPYIFRFRAPRIDRRMAVICIGGELHELGARMVADFCELAGWTTDYLGANVPAAGLPQILAARGVDVLAVSVTMTLHLSAVRELINTLRASEASSRIPILVGGRPFSIAPNLWRRIGADGWALDARDAVGAAARIARDQSHGVTGRPRGAGAAWLCDAEGRVVEVLRNDLGWLRVGETLPEAVDTPISGRARDFLAAVRSRMHVIDWTLPVSVFGRLQPLHFAGFSARGQMLVVAARRRARLRQVCQELASSQAGWAEVLRRALNEWADLASRAPRGGASLYDELSRLNNELVKLQRELALKNAELAHRSVEP